MEEQNGDCDIELEATDVSTLVASATDNKDKIEISSPHNADGSASPELRYNNGLHAASGMEASAYDAHYNARSPNSPGKYSYCKRWMLNSIISPIFSALYRKTIANTTNKQQQYERQQQQQQETQQQQFD